MTLFEYLSVAVSIVLSLALVRLVNGLRVAVESDGRYWIPTAWIGLLIGLCLTHWWTSWSFRGVDWTFPKFVLMLAGPAVLYAMATIAVPDDARSVGDWNQYFSSRRTSFYVVLTIYMLVSTFDGYFVAGAPLLVLPRLGPAMGFLLAAVSLVVKKPGWDAFVVAPYALLFAMAALALISAPDSIAIPTRPT